MFTNTWPNPVAHRIRVFFNETSTTIYEGMPVCYAFDTTTNWSGGSVSNGEITESTTTAEGSQNEGKYILVESPDADNLEAFAGVVASGGWCGTTTSSTKGKVVDIYVPNGAIVPVRAGCACTVGRTVLGVASAGTDLDTTGRPVGIAYETVDRSSTSGLCFAKLCPDRFLYQTGDNAALIYDDQNATSTIIANTLQYTESQTAGSFVNTMFHTTHDGNTSAACNTYGVLNYLSLEGTYDQTGYHRAFLSQLNISGTLNGGLHAAAAMVQLSGAPTFTNWESLSGLWVDCAITGVDNSGDPPSASTGQGDYSLVRLTNNGGSEDIVGDVFFIYGGYGIDKLFQFDTCINGGAADEHFIYPLGTGADKVITSGTTGTTLKVKCDVDGTSYYLILYADPTEAAN